MKDSGVEWIGVIPKEWTVLKLKSIADITMGQSPNSDEYNDSGIGIEFLQGNADFNDFYPSARTYAKKWNKQSKVNDILLSVRAPVGAKNISDREYAIGRGLCAITPNKVTKEFLWYLIDIMNEEFKFISKGSTYDSVTIEDVRNALIIFPEKQEQDRIINILDDKVSRIDAIIKKTKSTIEDYKRLKQSIITEAVTKGLDKNVEMKDSGIEWVGRIPKHWEVVKIKHLFDVINERNENEDAVLLSLFTALGVAPRSEMEDKGNKASTVMNYKLVKKDDLIVNKLLAWMGAVAFSNYNGVTSPDYDVYRLKINTRAFKEYYEWYFRFTNFKDDCYKYGRGIMMMRWRTYPSEFKMIDIVNPPHSEQVEIYEYLKSKVKEIDALIEKKNKLLSELETYKKSLIYEYVTGKKEVK